MTDVKHCKKDDSQVFAKGLCRNCYAVKWTQDHKQKSKDIKYKSWKKNRTKYLSCKRKYSKEYYKVNYAKINSKVNREKMHRYHAKKNQDKRNYIIGYKLNHPCSFCGESDTACLHFHHLDPSKKLFGLAKLTQHSLKEIIKEITKCIVLCANCHIKLHYYSRKRGN